LDTIFSPSSQNNTTFHNLIKSKSLQWFDGDWKNQL
jgi:hypothetical protein